jgi:hypothetical protein
MTIQLVLPLETAPPAAALVARLRSFGLPATVPVVLHRNRRVMVSFDRRGGLRVHGGYAFAPDPVVSALAGWARPRSRRADRRALARTFLAFPVDRHLPATRPRRRIEEPVEPGDQDRLDRLVALHREFNRRWFNNMLGTIPIRWSGRMRRKLGHFEISAEGPCAIVISRRHLRRDGWSRVAETLLHEMIHQWQQETGQGVDHGAAFRRKAREVGMGG